MEKLKSFPFMEKRKIYYIVTLVLIIASIATGLIRGYNFGIDFTGGTLMQIEMGKEVKISEINDILSDQKIDGNVTHAGDGNTQIIIKTTDSMESDTRTALMSALKEKYGVTDDAVLSIENIGPSVGETLKSSAFKATAIAIVLMLIYIAVRFMWKYGIAAIIALANTVLLVIGFYGVFHISINSPFIAAILTILGYGINDTIVIFDRIRENTDNSARRSAKRSRSARKPEYKADTRTFDHDFAHYSDRNGSSAYILRRHYQKLYPAYTRRCYLQYLLFNIHRHICMV